MPSPYGTRRSAAMYYQHAGAGRHYDLNWTGVPQGGARAGETRALGSDYIDITARYHKDLGFFGQMSDNEKRLGLLAGAALAGWLLWKHVNK